MEETKRFHRPAKSYTHGNCTASLEDIWANMEKTTPYFSGTLKSTCTVLGDKVEIDFGQETRSGSRKTDLEDILEEEEDGETAHPEFINAIPSLQRQSDGVVSERP
jgi:hypothetical protein